MEWEGGFEEVLDECDSRFEEARGQGDWGGDVAACGFAVGFDGVGGGGGVGCGVDEVRAVVVVPIERGDAVGGAERGECGGFGVGRVDDDFGEVDAGRHEAFDVVGFEGRCFGGGAAWGECKCSTYNDAARFESFDAFGGDISCDAVVHESVEVHGGATLEETVVPLIEFTLKSGADTEIRLINSNDIKVDRKKGVTIQLYISDIKKSNNLGLMIKGKRYPQCTILDEHHYLFELPDIKRSGRYDAEVYEGEDIIGKVVVNVKGAVGSSNNDFDDLF